jgi:hypothetical protein
MTKEAILRRIDTMRLQLDELRAAVEQLPDGQNGESLTDWDMAEGEGEDASLEAMLEMLRKAWDVPEEFVPEMTLEEAQDAMAEGMPENWASREIMRMREE